MQAQISIEILLNHVIVHKITIRRQDALGCSTIPNMSCNRWLTNDRN